MQKMLLFFNLILFLHFRAQACAGGCRTWENDLIGANDEQKYYSALLDKNKKMLEQAKDGSSLKMKIDSNIFIISSQLDGINENVNMLKKQITENCGDCER